MIKREFDSTILILAVALTCFGVLMVYSSSSIMADRRYHDSIYFLKRQGGFAASLDQDSRFFISAF